MFTGYPQAILFISWLSFAFSVVATVLAVKRTETASLKRKIGDQALVLHQLEAESAQLQAAWKRTNARIAMAQARTRSNAGSDSDLPDPKMDPEGWRDAVRNQFLTSKGR